MYPFEMNHYVEVLNYQKFSYSTVPEKAWSAADVWSLEAVLPPYLFLDGDRRPQSTSLFWKRPPEEAVYDWTNQLKDKTILSKANISIELILPVSLTKIAVLPPLPSF
jgi:hypothetical protein